MIRITIMHDEGESMHDVVVNVIHDADGGPVTASRSVIMPHRSETFFVDDAKYLVVRQEEKK